jgi:hypothetical protein
MTNEQKIKIQFLCEDLINLSFEKCLNGNSKDYDEMLEDFTYEYVALPDILQRYFRLFIENENELFEFEYVVDIAIQIASNLEFLDKKPF